MVAPPALSRRSFLKISTGGFAVGGVMSLVDVRSTQARAQSLKTAGVKEIPECLSLLCGGLRHARGCEGRQDH